MKKGLLSLLIVLVLAWSCGTVFAQGKGKGAGRQGKRAEKLQRKHKSRQADANEPGGQGKEKRVRRQEHRRKQWETRRKERQKIRVTRGKGHQQQLKSLKTQMVHEEAKHRRRIARLKRIRELAAEENDTKTVERVVKLLEMELLRHNHKRKRMQEREQKALQLAEKSLSEEAQKVIKKDTNKKKTKAKEQKQGQE
jgi:hypothetical protein